MGGESVEDLAECGGEGELLYVVVVEGRTEEHMIDATRLYAAVHGGGDHFQLQLHCWI